MCFGAFMGQLDASVVALTYRSIGGTFHAGLAAVQWVSLTYLITLAALLVPVGRMSDRLGRKRVYLWGFVLFTVASAGCAGAPTLVALVALRAAQGVGAALLQANSVALVATSAPPGRLRLALGMQASAQAVGLALGPTIGGVVVQTIGWRWVFALNVPVGVLAVIAGRYLLPRTRLESAGGTLRTVLRTPGVPRWLIGALLSYLLLFGPIVLVPTVLQAHGIAPLQAGLLVAALPTGFALGALADRVLPHRWQPGWRSSLGLMLTALGLGALLLVGVRPVWAALTLTAVGTGLGILTPTTNALIMDAVPSRLAGLAGGLVSTARAIGTAAGTAVVTAALSFNGSGRVGLAALLATTVAARRTVAVRTTVAARTTAGRPARARRPRRPEPR
ncbi:MAG: transporter [Pseudonocardiales bacterium]|nr:transporter [Pseudonocardiales bacterium]